MQHHYGLFLRNMPAQSNQQLALLIPTFQKKIGMNRAATPWRNAANFPAGYRELAHTP